MDTNLYTYDEYCNQGDEYCNQVIYYCCSLNQDYTIHTRFKKAAKLLSLPALRLIIAVVLVNRCYKKFGKMTAHTINLIQNKFTLGVSARHIASCIVLRLIGHNFAWVSDCRSRWTMSAVFIA